MYHGERFNSITHLVGAALALVGLVVLIVDAVLHGGAMKIVSVSIYGLSLLALYTCSTLYHSLRGAAKRVFQRLDHTAIYLLIAGTYTPLTLIVLRGRLGWWLFGIVWGLAAVGALQEFRHVKGERVLSLVIYIAMGWLAVVALRPLADALGPWGVAGLVAGGLSYTGGIAFYALDRRVPMFHGVWHLFVLAGSIAHYLVILALVD
jgi:hemolysin III